LVISWAAAARATAIKSVMEESTVSFQQLATTSKHFVRRLAMGRLRPFP